MAKLKLIIGSLVLLVLIFSFNSYFTLTALAKLFAKLLGTSPEFQTLLTQTEISIYIHQQIWKGIVILLFASQLLVAIVSWRTPSARDQWSLQSASWLLFLVGGSTQLLALGIYIGNFIAVAPINRMVAASLLDISIEIITTLIITGLLYAESITLLLKYLQRNCPSKQSLSVVDPGSIRPVVFLLLFGIDLSASFVPLHMKNLYQPLLGLPEDVVLGLPISTMFLCVGITIILSGIWLDRRGWHEPLLVGLALSASGMIYAWLGQTAIHFTIAMSFVGLGYGLALMAPQGFVMVHTDDKNKAQGLAYLFAGMYAGSICGTGTGAMLAERIGYSPVFLLSSIMIILALGYTWIALRNTFNKQGRFDRRTAHRYPRISLQDLFKPANPEDHIVITSQVVPSITAKHYLNFLSNRYVLSLIFLSSLPSAIAVIGFLNYFVPIYLYHLGFSHSVTGSVLIIYGLCMVYLGPFISQFIDNSLNKRLFVITGCILGSCGFLSFPFINGLTGTLLAIMLVGLSSCFVLASQTVYVLMLDVTKHLGSGRAVGIFRASSRIGQMLGPILFGWLMVNNDIHQSVIYLGVGYLITTILFVLMTSAKSTIIKEATCCEHL